MNEEKDLSRFYVSLDVWRKHSGTHVSNSSIMARRPGRWVSTVPVDYFTLTYHEERLGHGMILNNGNVKSKLCFITNAVFTLTSFTSS
jgi:hypothetical protein